MELIIKRTNSENLDFIKLSTLLDKGLWENYPENGTKYWNNNIIEFNENVILIYYKDKAAACACFKEYDSNTIEIKRMFVSPEVRGLGLAKKILAELELLAINKGYSKSLLETLYNQEAAIGLYQRVGYKIIEKYGPYINSKESVCMEKIIN